MVDALGSEQASAGSSREELAVIRVSGDWRIYKNGQDAGRFDYKVDAIEAALRLVAKAEQAGAPAQVLVQDPYGELSRLDLPSN